MSVIPSPRTRDESLSSFDRIVRRAKPGERLMKLVMYVMPDARKGIWRSWYDMLNSRLNRSDAPLVFMNYGFAHTVAPATPLALEPADEPDRNPIQLYHRVATAVDIRGKDLLEVGCGRGGGSSFISRYLEPRSVVGIDYSARAVDYCARLLERQGLTFRQGDAEKLPFDAGSFDAVVNVESSHCYGSMEGFLSEVNRVLRLGGHLLLADLRIRPKIDLLRQQIRDAGFTILEEETITPNVIRAMETQHDKYRSLVRKHAPRLLRAPVENFAGVKGSRIHELLSSGKFEYLRFAARKDRATG